MLEEYIYFQSRRNFMGQIQGWSICDDEFRQLNNFKQKRVEENKNRKKRKYILEEEEDSSEEDYYCYDYYSDYVNRYS